MKKKTMQNQPDTEEVEEKKCKKDKEDERMKLKAQIIGLRQILFYLIINNIIKLPLCLLYYTRFRTKK